MGLRPGALCPPLAEQATRLGGKMPFREAADEVRRSARVAVSASTVHRLTRNVGTDVVAINVAEEERLQRDLPPPPPGSAAKVLCPDGAMLRTRERGWCEVKTLAIGEPVTDADSGETHTTALSYVSRLAGIEAFSSAVLPELHRRGVESAALVQVLGDGAGWIDTLAAEHCPRAVRTVDFWHGSERLGAIGHAIYGATMPKGWLERQCHTLKHDGPRTLLRRLARTAARHGARAATEADRTYLRTRQGQMDYPRYRQLGLPIGSGSGESAHAVVWQGRMKGPGMFWAERTVKRVSTP